MRAPGVYFEKADLGPQPVSVRTDVAAFVGFAERGPIDLPTAIDSYTQFETIFGKPRSDLHLGWCVRGFFENGGIRAWICRAAAPEAARAFATISDANGPAFRVEASSAGQWGNLIETNLIEATGVETTSLGPVIEDRGIGVADTTAFVRGDLLRLRQADGFEALRVVNTVDHATGRIFWAAGAPENGLPSDETITGYNPALPFTLLRQRYSVIVSVRGRIAARIDDFGIVAGGPAFAEDIVDGLPAPIRIVDIRQDPSVAERLALPTAPMTLSGGQDGLNTVKPEDMERALRAFRPVDEPALFAMPDIHEPLPLPTYAPTPEPEINPCLTCPPQAPRAIVTPEPQPETPPGFDLAAIARLQHLLIDWCAARPNAFALLDVPRGIALDSTQTQQLITWRNRFDSAFGALFYPWLRVPQANTTRPARETPSAGHIAGQMAAMDLAVGPHHSAANQALRWAQSLTAETTSKPHGILNDAGVNVIQGSRTRGLRRLGARTLSNDPFWPFIPVRRLMSMIGYALSLSSRWALFEPNTYATRAKLAAVYQSYLTAIWRRGGLSGTEPAEAFFVSAEPAEDEALSGRLTMTVGVAPLNPLEYIVFRIGREDGSISIEGPAAGRFEGAA